MKNFICVEDGEYFTVKESSFDEAQEAASLYNGSCIRELTPAECVELKEGITYEQLTAIARK